MKTILRRNSDLMMGEDIFAKVNLTSLGSLRRLMVDADGPLLVKFAREQDAPAELEIVIVDEEEWSPDHYEI